MTWKGSKNHPKCVAVHPNRDPHGERTVIREVDFDAKTMTLLGDGSVDYDHTLTAADVVANNKAAAEKAEREAELETAVKKVVEKKQAPAKRGRPPKAAAAAKVKG